MNIKVVNIRGLNDFTGIERVDRGFSILGNPFPMPNESMRDQVIQAYKIRLWAEIQKRGQIWRELTRLLAVARNGGLVLGCWCAPKACHAEVIAKCLEWMDTLQETR